MKQDEYLEFLKDHNHIFLNDISQGKLLMQKRWFAFSVINKSKGRFNRQVISLEKRTNIFATMFAYENPWAALAQQCWFENTSKYLQFKLSTDIDYVDTLLTVCLVVYLISFLINVMQRKDEVE